MGQQIEDRMGNLERFAFESEGAQFATRHLLAMRLARLDRDEAEDCLRELQAIGRLHGAALGELRLKGYLDELDAVRDATHQNSPEIARALRVVR